MSPTWRRIVGFLILAVFLTGLGLAGYDFARPWIYRLDSYVPAATALMELRKQQAIKRGEKYRVHNRFVPLKAISPALVQAVLIAEDDKFLGHEGFDWDMMQRALERNISSGTAHFGASTISQQLAKNLFLSPERSLWRKIREAIITLGLEACLSKRRILELYLNYAEWGRGVFGAEAAARVHFAKPASKLTIWQAACLAAVLPAPLSRDPAQPKPFVRRRAREIMQVMYRRGVGVLWH